MSKKHGTALGVSLGNSVDFIGECTKEITRAVMSGKIRPEVIKLFGIGHNEELAQIFVEAFNKSVLKPILQLYKKFTLPATDGQLIIVQCGEIFRAGIHGFCDTDTTNQKKAMPETPIKVYDLADRAKYKQMFDFLSKDTAKLVLTQHQVVTYVKNHRNELEIINLFVCKKDEHKTGKLADDDFFVAMASVDMGSDGALNVYRDDLRDGRVWTPDGDVRVVTRSC